MAIFEISRSIKNLIHKFLLEQGYVIRRAEKAMPPPPVYDHPKTALYKRNPQREQLNAVRWDLNVCVNMQGQVFGCKGWHPYTKTLREYVSGRHKKYSGSILERYFKVCQPENVQEFLLPGHPNASELQPYHPAGAVVPWTYTSPAEANAHTTYMMKHENEQEGKSLSAEAGFSQFGPVTAAKGRLEFNRLTKLYHSIKQHGYRREGNWDGDIRGFVLRRGEEFRVVINSGNHRAAVLALLGDGTAPVRLITPVIIEARDVETWPQVQEGIWTRETALQYFNRLFDFDSVEWAKKHGVAARETDAHSDDRSASLDKERFGHHDPVLRTLPVTSKSR